MKKAKSSEPKVDHGHGDHKHRVWQRVRNVARKVSWRRWVFSFFKQERPAVAGAGFLKVGDSTGRFAEEMTQVR
jgi:hypothetical protein